MPTALTIAGSDSSAGAGVQVDLRTFAAHEVYGVCALTAVTAQNTVAVTDVHPVPAGIVAAQIEAVVGDIGVNAAKTGMLSNRSVVETVAQCIRDLDIPSVVVDPVITSTTGCRLLDDDAVGALRSDLLPLARCVTPNRMEAEILTNCAIGSIAAARDAARRIVDLGAASVVITGGHFSKDDVIDLLFDGRDLIEFSRPSLDCPSIHGTGCTFSAALTAALARGEPLADSVDAAKSFVYESIRHSSKVGSGAHVMTHLPYAVSGHDDR